MACEQRDVFAARREGRELHGGNETRPQIVLDHGRIAVGCGNEAKIRTARHRFTQALVLAARVEHAQEMRLRLLDRQLTDLVEEQRSPMGLADEPWTLGHSGVRIVLRAPEKFGVDETRRMRGGIPRDERFRRAIGHGVDGTGRQLFARSARPDEQCMRAEERATKAS